MISIYEESPGVRRLKFDFSKFKENPKFEAIVSGKKQEFKFDFNDFNDWNSTNEQVTVRKNGKIEYSQNDAVIPEQIYNDEFKVYFTILIENKDSEVKFTDEDFLCSCNCIEKIYTTNAAYRLLLDKEKLKNKSILTLKTNESVYNYVIKKADIDESGNSLSLIFENKKLYNIIDR